MSHRTFPGVRFLAARRPAGPWEVGREVAGVDDLGPRVEVRGGAGGARGGEDGQALRVRQVTGAVGVFLVLGVVAVHGLWGGGRGVHGHVAQAGDGGQRQGEGPSVSAHPTLILIHFVAAWGQSLHFSLLLFPLCR
jgi:hypothetical protein